ncbi:MAG TPA: serine/threonine-protein kinase [Polyangiales bacterium]|nr:serine/threonine-protein kinase [Polyangiales bacterium]
MPNERPLSGSETSEDERAFLQARVALFWKAACFIILFGSGLGALGTIVDPGPDFVLTLASGLQAGLFWWICQRGVRSIRFSRAMESVGLLINSALGALIGRYIFIGFAREHAVAAGQATVLADAYMGLMQVGGTTLFVAIRAALIPSRPRRTAIISTLCGVPMIFANTFLVPKAGGGFAWRTWDSGSLPWLPLNLAVMWSFAVITSVIISRVIYGLRAEVRKARRLGQYVLEQKLGAGGMGEVYRAQHGMMRRPSAIKLLRNERSGERELKRFEREVQLTARLTHPNTITIFDYGRTHEGIFYYAMELLDGANLQRVVAHDGPQPAGRVVRILSMVCGALAEAHAIGLIHRDIKPANIMLCRRGGEYDVVKLLDFGLVKEFRTDAAVELTAASTILGTPQYMAPETIRLPDAADERSDLYALGAVAYYLLAGVEVFDGKSVVEVCAQHLHEAPKPFAQRGVSVPAALEALVLACLEKEPEARPQSASELRRRLEACRVEPWDADTARTWWIEHQRELEVHAKDDGAGRTVAPV